MKSTLIIIVVLILVVGGATYFFVRPALAPSPAPTPSPAATPAPAPTPPPAGAGPASHIISMAAGGFQPANLTIKAGDTVVFRNDDARQHWPASGVHPTHLLCPGFDALRPMATGETYSHTFTEAKECPMHDHLTPSLQGKITVTE